MMFRLSVTIVFWLQYRDHLRVLRRDGTAQKPHGEQLLDLAEIVRVGWRAHLRAPIAKFSSSPKKSCLRDTERKVVKIFRVKY